MNPQPITTVEELRNVLIGLPNEARIGIGIIGGGIEEAAYAIIWTQRQAAFQVVLMPHGILPFKRKESQPPRY